MNPVKIGDPVPLSVIKKAHIEAVIERARTLHEAAHILKIDGATLYRFRAREGMPMAVQRGGIPKSYQRR